MLFSGVALPQILKGFCCCKTMFDWKILANLKAVSTGRLLWTLKFGANAYIVPAEATDKSAKAIKSLSFPFNIFYSQRYFFGNTVNLIANIANYVNSKCETNAYFSQLS